MPKSHLLQLQRADHTLRSGGPCSEAWVRLKASHYGMPSKLEACSSSLVAAESLLLLQLAQLPKAGGRRR